MRAMTAIVLTCAVVISCGGGGGGAKTLPALYEQPQGGQPVADTPADVTQEPADGQASEADPGEGGDENEGEEPRYEYGDLVWWENPLTGEAGYISEGFATIGLDYFPSWIFGPPAEADKLDEEFINQPTVQALLERGFELLQPYGCFQAGEFKLPPDMTFAEAYVLLPEEYPDISYVDPWGNADLTVGSGYTFW